MDVRRLQDRLHEFAVERDREKFHSPKNLAMALASEAGELLDILQWKTEEESRALSADDLIRVREELADVLIYVLRIADVLAISLDEAAQAKLRLNEQHYPIKESFGNATKYSRRRPP
jgi:dCTP diphosphatase